MKNNIRDWSNMAENTRKFEGMKEEKEKEDNNKRISIIPL